MTEDSGTIQRYDRILLTGAAGGLGKVLRETLRPYARILRLSDIAALAPSQGPHEEIVPCDLTDKDAVDALLEGVDAVVHLGGISVERPFEEVVEANIRGTYHLYEAARRNGVRRVVFASSNHVIGFHRQGVRLDSQSPRRPDGYYGLSKSFGEDLASFYHDRYGIETVSLRIGSSYPKPRNRRMMHTWLSYRDLTELVRCGLYAPGVGHTVAYGASANRDGWWDNRGAAVLGYAPQDSSEAFREEIERLPAPAADDPDGIYQGGAFTAAGPYENVPPVRRATRPAGEAELVLHVRNQTGESPVWHAQEQALYWVDIPAGVLHRWRVHDQQHASWRANQPLGCIARASEGGWIGAMEDGVYRLAPGPDQVLSAQAWARVDHARSGMRFNDGRCDRQGRFWAGTMLTDMAQAAPVGALYRLTGRGDALRLERMAGELIVPNGLAFSPDGRTMYLSDSHPQRQCVWAYDYDIDAGVPGRRRVFIDRLVAGRPDGAAVDAEGCYWICGNDAGMVHRYTPDGRLDRSLRVPVAKPAMCAFGGKDLDTLFVTSIRLPDAAPHALDGAVFALRPGVGGIEEPVFTG